MRILNIFALLTVAFALVSCGGQGQSSDSMVPDSATKIQAPAPTSLQSHAFPGAPITDIAYGAGIYVAAANGGVLTSTDGVIWTISPKFTDEQLKKILFAGNRFVAFGDQGSVFSSTNGAEWTQTKNALPEMLDVAFVGSRFIAVLTKGIVTSDDAVTWTTRWPVGDASFEGFSYPIGEQSRIRFMGGKFFVLSDTAIYESTDGTAWVRVAKPPEAPQMMMRSISYGNGLFILMLSYPKLTGDVYTGIPPGSYIYSSPDGLTWTPRFSSTTEVFHTVAFMQDQFIAAGQDGALRTSSDGINWTAHGSGTTEWMTDVVYVNGQYVALGSTLFHSADGISWSAASTNRQARDVISRLIQANGKLFALAGRSIGTTTDGKSWNFVSPIVPVFEEPDVTFANGLFVAVGGGLSVWYTIYVPGDPLPEGWLLTSADGVRWTLRAVGSDMSLKSVVHGGGRFVAVGGPSVSNAGSTILTSEDGMTWTRQKAPSNAMLSKVVYGAGQYIAISNDLVAKGDDPIRRYEGSIIGSTDGVNWTIRLPAIDGEVEGIAYGNGRFAVAANVLSDNSASGYTNVIYTSTDGIRWTSNPYPYHVFAGIAFSNGMFVSGGAADLISSSDGIQWTRHPVGDVFLLKIVADAGNFIAYSATDMMRVYFTSTDGTQWTRNFHAESIGGMSTAAYGASKWVMFGGLQGVYMAP
ncbi:hypothetical protein EGT07_01840 [Herbaspirillum sp. HC18]|nr:hypothetical protein EGT07_01840 [Herbaspirillum sp. HC18]